MAPGRSIPILEVLVVEPDIYRVRAGLLEITQLVSPGLPLVVVHDGVIQVVVNAAVHQHESAKMEQARKRDVREIPLTPLTRPFRGSGHAFNFLRYRLVVARWPMTKFRNRSFSLAA